MLPRSLDLEGVVVPWLSVVSAHPGLAPLFLCLASVCLDTPDKAEF